VSDIKCPVHGELMTVSSIEDVQVGLNPHVNMQIRASLAFNRKITLVCSMGCEFRMQDTETVYREFDYVKIALPQGSDQ